MISYRIAEPDLLALIDACDATWRVRAAEATAACKRAGKFVKEDDVTGKEIEGLWGDIKEVFMDLQHTKCCYCERKLASKDRGKVEHDIEHFALKAG